MSSCRFRLFDDPAATGSSKWVHQVRVNSLLVLFEGKVVFSSSWRRVGRPAENLTGSQA